VPIIIRRPKCASATPPSATPPPATPPSATPPSAITSTGLTPKRTKLRPTRRLRREDAARALAPVIKEIREAGHDSNAEIAKCLNERGLRAPSGGPFSPETTRKIQLDIKRFGLGDGPRSISKALTERHRKRRERQAIELERALKEADELKAQKRREHPDWPITRPWLR
jgi:hypothetical protein